MELKVKENKGLTKRERFWSLWDKNKRYKKRNLKEALAQAKREGVICKETREDGTARIRVLVKKQNLKRMIDLLKASDDDHGDGDGDHEYNVSVSRSSPSVEQRLKVLQRKHKKVEGRFSWTPMLQSIPEEF